MRSLLARARWYRNRLAAMSALEVMHRFQESLYRKADRLAASRLIPQPANDSALPTIPGLKEGLNAWDVPADLLTRWEESLHQSTTGLFFMLGQQWPACTRDSRWHFDPVTGEFWPHEPYCFDINYRHTSRMGDIKYVWELNRLQYLQPVAALAFKRQDRELGLFCLAEIESWINNNPPHRGVNWASGIELAFRTISILTVITLVTDYSTAGQRAKIMATLEAHALWLERYPSEFSSANNHRAAEGLGLFVVGALCPQFARSKTWKEYGWGILCETARRQILADGVGAEQTITYTAVVLEMLLFGLHIARNTKTTIPDYYNSRIMRGGEYLRWFTDRGGGQPRIGDDDNARLLGSYLRDEAYVRMILGCVAAVGNRPDLTPPLLEASFRQSVFGFAPPADFSPSGVRHFDHGGYTVGRHQAHGREIMLAMDHGYLGYLSIAAHGHADALAIWLHIDDQPVLVDAGTYLYHSGAEWRDYFRGTAAHNTLCLEDSNSSAMSGNFNWSHKANATVRKNMDEGSKWWIEAEHDGYVGKFGITHRRRLTVEPAIGFTVEDYILGPQAHAVDIGFLLHPALTAEEHGTEVHVSKNGTLLLRISHVSPLKMHIGHPGNSFGGWYSPTFGEKQATRRVVFSGTLCPNQPSRIRFTYI
jgi:hypothetical protein